MWLPDTGKNQLLFTQNNPGQTSTKMALFPGMELAINVTHFRSECECHKIS
jgi:hypothetical protein